MERLGHSPSYDAGLTLKTEEANFEIHIFFVFEEKGGRLTVLEIGHHSLLTVRSDA